MVEVPPPERRPSISLYIVTPMADLASLFAQRRDAQICVATEVCVGGAKVGVCTPMMSTATCFVDFLRFALVLALLSSLCVPSAATLRLSSRENIECTYANSTCSAQCDSLCLHGEFYPLLPSRCHPLYLVRLTLLSPLSR